MGLFIRTIGIAPYWIALNGARWSIEVAVNPLEYAVDEWLGAGVPKRRKREFRLRKGTEHAGWPWLTTTDSVITAFVCTASGFARQLRSFTSRV